MPSMLVLPGRKMNLLADAQQSASSSVYDNCEIASLFDNQPSNAFRWGTPAASDYVKFDLNWLPNGDMEDWPTSGIPSGGYEDVSDGTGAIVKDTVTYHAGAVSAKLDGNGSGNKARLRRIIWLPTGKPGTIEAWMRRTTGTTSGYLVNLSTGNYLNSSGVWTATPTPWATHTTSTWTIKTRTFTMETYIGCGNKHLVPVAVIYVNEDVGHVDDIALWMHWNFTSIHGHNFPVDHDIEIQSDDNYAFASPTTKVTFAAAERLRGGFWEAPSATVVDRYVQMEIQGTAYGETEIGDQPEIPVYVGEWVVGYSTEITSIFDYPYSSERSRPIAGTKHARFTRSEDKNIVLDLDFTNTPTALAAIYEVLERCREGADPCVVVPLDDQDEAHFGYFPPKNKINRRFINRYEYKLQFEEMPFPYDLVVAE